MKFITSTHLKQWADTRECQGLLPELMRRLICASVSAIDRISFPVGDAVHMPGWDGIVASSEAIDVVPEGISLWECGATEGIKAKANGDYAKRTKNPLGYDKSAATFVFVAPREWQGADEWLRNHQGEWKNVFVYTAVELEAWIEKFPSVGMWLASKLNILPAGGYCLPEDYWSRWATGKDIILPYDIVLSGRQEESHKILEGCKTPSLVTVEAFTQSEGIAFSIATLSSSAESDKLISRAIVVTDKNAFDDLTSHYRNLIVITSLDDIPYTVLRNGHTVIRAVTPNDQEKMPIRLPIVEKEGFVAALETCGIDSIQARKIATDTARDVNVLRRMEHIGKAKPEWADDKNLKLLLPAILIGRWQENIEGDKAIVEKLAGCSYDNYARELKLFQKCPDSPVRVIGSQIRIKAPTDVFPLILGLLTDGDLANLKAICLQLVADDDPNAVEKVNSAKFQFWKYEQVYSATIKEGVYQSLILLSLLASPDSQIKDWVDSVVRNMLQGWDYKRLLSNRHFLTLLAEASPEEFLSFVESLDKGLLQSLLTPNKPEISLTGWDIYYTELLWSLEMLAWGEDYLYRVTSLLLEFSYCKNESNYVNRPDNSLRAIYRFQLSQTFATPEQRLSVLNSLKGKFPEAIFDLCFHLLDTIDRGVFEPSHYYRWRMFSKISFPKHIYAIPPQHVCDSVALMLDCCDFSIDAINKLIPLSSKKYMACAREMMLAAIVEHKSQFEGNETVCKTIREDITHNLSCPDAVWALSKEELQPYQDLLDSIEPSDALERNKWKFEDAYLRLPHKYEPDYRKEIKEVLAFRVDAVKEIVSERGEEGIWDLMAVAGYPESVVDCVFSLYGENWTERFVNKYIAGTIGERILVKYFSTLFYSNQCAYSDQFLAGIFPKGNASLSAMTLYAPGYNESLAAMADKQDDDIQNLYWKNVRVSFLKSDNLKSIVDKLLNADRWKDAVELIYHNRETHQLDEVFVSQLLRVFVLSGRMVRERADIYYVSSLLEDLDKSDNPGVISNILPIEFYLYEALKHRQNISESRLVREMMTNPSQLMEVLRLVFLDDEGQSSTNDLKEDVQKLLAECAFRIYYDLHTCPCVDACGAVDEPALKAYISELYRLAGEQKLTNATNIVVGDLLGCLPRNEHYPQDALCELVEKISSDVVDRHIQCKIFNSRGVTTRAYNEGGDQERALIAKYKEYKDKVKFKSPRMGKIFDNLIKDYESQARHADIVAELEDLA